MNSLISLYDASGNWPEPFARSGWIVHQLDLKLGYDVLDFDTAQRCLETFGDVDGILAAPECRVFTNSSAWKWPDYNRDGETEASLQLVRQVQRFAELFKPTDFDYYRESGKPFFWALENPPGRLPKLVPGLGEAFFFHPWEYAGYLDHSEEDLARLEQLRNTPVKDITWEDAEFVLDCNAYTKHTGIWGEFCRHIPKKPILPVKCCPSGSPMQMLGGNRERTKEIRSRTPLGFARAFYEANKDYQAPLSRDKQTGLFGTGDKSEDDPMAWIMRD